MNRRQFLGTTSSSLAAVALAGCSTTSSSSAGSPWPKAKRVIFLGDSITYAGGYIDFLQTWLLLRHLRTDLECIDLGLPSETVSGLSEPGHANGAFPRPDLHERLDRVLVATEPDTVSACYGMNCGMYHPFAEERFAKYREGIEWVRERARVFDATVLHLTPPVFDPEPIRAKVLPAGLAEYRQPFEGYNDVLDRYSAWLVSQRRRGWEVVDTHAPMNRYLAEQRKGDPSFFLAKDGVHMNETGHWLAAREIILHFGDAEIGKAESPAAIFALHPSGGEIFKLVQKRQRILKDAWLTATGHKRPGMKKGLPLEQARAEVAPISAEIEKLLGA